MKLKGLHTHLSFYFAHKLPRNNFQLPFLERVMNEVNNLELVKMEPKGACPDWQFFHWNLHFALQNQRLLMEVLRPMEEPHHMTE